MENSAFLHELAHDMRAPLSAINGFANAILDGTIPPENQKRYIGIIADESKALSLMLDRVLSASRLQSGAVTADVSRFELAELVHAALLLFEDKVAARGLRLEIATEQVYICADRMLIQSVVTNLLENAVKYTPSGGNVRVSVSAEDKGARFTVSNTCNNLQEGEAERLTHRFYRSSGAVESGVKGTGLGLYIVEKALALHGKKPEISLSNGIISFSFVL